MQGGDKGDTGKETEDNEEGWAGPWGNDSPGNDKLARQEVDGMLDEGARTGKKGARIGKERGTVRMGWTGTRLMAMGGATEAEGRHCNRDDKMARVKRVGRRRCA